VTALLHFEDFHVGQRLSLGPYEVTKEEIVAFAREFDPQPHHLDEEAAKHSMLGGLGASGWHVCAMTMRMFVDGLAAKTATRGGAGVEDCRWLKPVRPGDVLRLELEVTELRSLDRRPEFGYAKLRWDVFNQREQVASMIVLVTILRRGG